MSSESQAVTCLSYPGIALTPRTAGEWRAMYPEMMAGVPEEALGLLFYAAGHPERDERFALGELQMPPGYGKSLDLAGLMAADGRDTPIHDEKPAPGYDEKDMPGNDGKEHETDHLRKGEVDHDSQDVPIYDVLDTPDPINLGAKLEFDLVCLGLFAAMTLCARSLSRKRFEKLDIR